MDPGLEQQSKWFQDRLDVDLKRFAIDWDRLVEIFQRRHLLVHAGGRVNRRYNAKVATRYQAELDRRLKVDLEYLDVAIDELYALGVGLTVAAWWKFANDDQNAAGSQLLSTAARAARAERWHVVRRLINVSQRFTVSQWLELEFRVLGWLAAQRLDDSPPTDEIECWDISALSTKWAVAKACLLGDTDEAVALLPEAFARRDISPMALFREPLYSPLLQRDAVRNLLKAHGLKARDWQDGPADVEGEPSTDQGVETPVVDDDSGSVDSPSND